MSDDLPEGWTTTKISDFTTKVGSGATPRGGSESYKDSGIPLIRSQNVHLDGFRDQGLAYLDDVQANALKEVSVEAGDVLLNITGASIGRVTQAPQRMQGARVNQHVCIIRPVNLIGSGYLACYLSSPVVQKLVIDEEYGVTRQALTKVQILDFNVPIAPAAEQARIVAKVDTLPARVNAARQRLAKVPAILKRFRQSVLEAACSGRLTTDWRQTHADVESASVLKERICKERQIRLQDERSSKQKPDGVHPLDTRALPEVPEKWYKTSLEAVTWRLTYGITVRPEYVDEGVSIISAREIRSGEVDIDIAKRISRNDYHGLREKCRIYFGDILFGKTGSIGAVARVKAKVSLCSSQNIAVISPLIEPAFLELVLRSPSIQHLASDSVKDTAIPDLQLGFMARFPILLPPEQEQHEIVRRVEALFRLADAIEKRVAAATARAERITQAILAKAFRGELVPTEAELARREGRSYEPASGLLEKIRTREAQRPERRRRVTGKANPSQPRRPKGQPK
jgi:type I restriction enzyme, S subunit